MKRILYFFAAFALVLGLILPHGTIAEAATYYPGTKIEPESGDVLITSKDSTRYYTGHAAIVTDKLTVVEIAGVGYNPTEQSLSSWLKKYPLYKVIRHDKSKTANKAGKWARLYVEDYPDAEYAIPSKLGDFTKTYCSKIVWQAYYYGADFNLFDEYLYTPSGKRLHSHPESSALFTPYDLVNGNKMTVIYTSK